MVNLDLGKKSKEKKILKFCHLHRKIMLNRNSHTKKKIVEKFLTISECEKKKCDFQAKTNREEKNLSV